MKRKTEKRKKPQPRKHRMVSFAFYVQCEASEADDVEKSFHDWFYDAPHALVLRPVCRSKAVTLTPTDQEFEAFFGLEGGK